MLTNGGPQLYMKVEEKSKQRITTVIGYPKRVFCLQKTQLHGPDPENFLCLFYSPNIDEKGGAINNFKFRNTEFDTYFQKALKELNNDKRNEYLVKCDQLVIDHAATVPLLTDDLIIMVNVRIRDFKTNNLQAMDFSRLYIKEQR